jgi:rhamnulokinase
LSSGTWSLLGIELAAPVLSQEVFDAKFSNEQGLEGTTRFLTNIAGMWLLQECRRVWAEQGHDIEYGEMVEMARNANAAALIDPDAPWQVDGDRMAALAGNTPFDRLPVQGRVRQMLKGGKLI